MLFSSYLKLALRSIQKNWMTSWINILGLSVAVALTISTFILVDLQLNMDSFHSKADRIYQVTTHVEEDGRNVVWSPSPLLLGPVLASDLTSVTNYSRMKILTGNIRFEEKVFREGVTFVDAGFWEMFDFPSYRGDLEFESRKDIILSLRKARKYFGDKDPVGKVLSLKYPNGKISNFVVKAVIDEYPNNAYLRGDIFLLIDNFLDAGVQERFDWSDMTDATFVMLDENSKGGVQSIPDDEYVALQNSSKSTMKMTGLQLFPFKEVSLEAHNMANVWGAKSPPGGRIALIVLSLFVLLMACFNFLNISVAEISKRLKEIGLRKVFGSKRTMVIHQFLTENLLKCFFAFLIGAILSYLIIVPGFDNLLPLLELDFRTSDPSSLVIFFIALFLFVGLLSGAYPAFYISKFEPVQIFRGSQKFGVKSRFAKILLGFQLFLTFQTVVACFVFVDQGLYLAEKSWGYEPGNMITITVDSKEQFLQLTKAVEEHPKVTSSSGGENHIGFYGPVQYYEFGDKRFPFRSFQVLGGYMETMGLELIAGRFISDQVSDQQTNIVVNAKFVEQMGWNEGLDQQVNINGGNYNVVGVVRDFRHGDFYSKIDPMIFKGAEEDAVNYFVARTTAGIGNMTEVDASLQLVWETLAPNDPYIRTFQEDIFAEFYEGNKSNMTITITISILATILASLGLFGLISFSTQRRIKEFGIRKVLGASQKEIIKQATGTYLIIVTISFVLGAPLGFYGINQIVQSVFHETKETAVLPFVLSILLIVSVMTITSLGQITKALKVNPASILRNN